MISWFLRGIIHADWHNVDNNDATQKKTKRRLSDIYDTLYEIYNKKIQINSPLTVKYNVGYMTTECVVSIDKVAVLGVSSITCRYNYHIRYDLDSYTNDSELFDETWNELCRVLDIIDLEKKKNQQADAQRAKEMLKKSANARRWLEPK